MLNSCYSAALVCLSGTIADDALIVSRMKSSRMKSSSLILILEIAKDELSYTGVVPATESPMPKSEGVNQKKLC